jgi:hypothetical protein
MSCEEDKKSPEVETIYFSDLNKGEQQEIAAASKLYEHYMNSSKDKEFYEVVSRGDFILNYYPSKQLITICVDPGSGWFDQFKEVDAGKLEELSKAKLPFNKYNTLLVQNDPMQSKLIKSNGNPN